MKTIDINDWVLSGGGGAGVSYFHKTDPSLILKMDNREVSLEEVEKSLETARIVYNLGIPTPEPGEVVFDGERYGQIFHRIQNKVSYARLIGQKPELIPALAHEFAVIIKKLHSTKAKGSGLRSIKEIYGDFVLGNPYRPQELKDRAMALLASLPEADTCVHGDLHYGNIIKADGKDYLIDISSFGYGHPYFDFSMIAAIRKLAPFNADVHQNLFHHSMEQSDLFWDCFNKEYFGRDITAAQVEQEVFPYLVIRMLTMETESQRPLPPPAIELVTEYLQKFH